MSHLTCNKAEQITCSLPLTVHLSPQGVPISFNTIPPFEPPCCTSQHISMEGVGWGAYSDGFMATASSLKEHIDCKQGGWRCIEIDVGIFIQYACVMPREGATNGVGPFFKAAQIDHDYHLLRQRRAVH